METIGSWVALLAVSLALVILIPYIAWNGRPRDFKRLNWIGVTVGSFVLGSILVVLGFIARDSEAGPVGLLLLGCAGILIALGIGSLVAVFFFRPNG